MVRLTLAKSDNKGGCIQLWGDLMKIITGRKALDESGDEDNDHLVTWFKRRLTDKENFKKAIDPAVELNQETLGSIPTVELAGHCGAREPNQRPEMGYVVNVLSSIVELWIPSKPNTYCSDLDMSHLDDSSSSYLPSGEISHTSIPTRHQKWRGADKSHTLEERRQENLQAIKLILSLELGFLRGLQFYSQAPPVRVSAVSDYLQPHIR
ncbi:hypothetical protein SAY87_010906 [Trapa incisa]|uniref:Uncharacterized protein n=1 Tax=Trapa incisa TaxID=236973 RepID=A0AAN7JHY7_9MYRT|nr:hypothetical protein SAY87_010906 [Trapa incisa]